ncbi:MAG TPA: 2-phospho-L-lactate guanylyltransferase [Rhizomicrobium sp.]|jgi:2-phospho-L-lactate guanylyltransferase
MSLRIILPVKPFAEAKQRLASVLSPAARAELAENMFRHVLGVACDFAEPRAVIVVSLGREVLAVAAAHGATPLAESSQSGLNGALRQAREFVFEDGALRLLVVASDLPLLHRDDLAALTEQDCAIAPDRHRQGTNALLWPASARAEFHFGENSFPRHCEAAKSAGLSPQIIIRPNLAHDVDLPADLLATTTN